MIITHNKLRIGIHAECKYYRKIEDRKGENVLSEIKPATLRSTSWAKLLALFFRHFQHTGAVAE